MFKCSEPLLTAESGCCGTVWWDWTLPCSWLSRCWNNLVAHDRCSCPLTSQANESRKRGKRGDTESFFSPFPLCLLLSKENCKLYEPPARESGRAQEGLKKGRKRRKCRITFKIYPLKKKKPKPNTKKQEEVKWKETWEVILWVSNTVCPLVRQMLENESVLHLAL